MPACCSAMRSASRGLAARAPCSRAPAARAADSARTPLRPRPAGCVSVAAIAAAASPPAAGAARGRSTARQVDLNVVPRPGSLSTQMCRRSASRCRRRSPGPSPVPLPGSLVVKNGSKTCACTSAVMPQPVSLTREHHVAARARASCCAGHRSRVAASTLRGLDGQPAALRHRVAGVDGEVQDHLLDLARVGLDAAPGRVRARSSSSMSSPISRRSIVSMRVRRTSLRSSTSRLQHLLPAEGEQLPGQRRRALARRVADLGDVARGRDASVPSCFEHQFARTR